MNKPTVRSSTLPLFMVCGYAVLNPDNLVRVEQDNEAGVTGTLVHQLCQDTVVNGHADLESLKGRLAQDDYDRAGKLYRNFLTVWSQARKVMTDPQTEVYLEAELSHLKITGHVDLCTIGPSVAYILDYKTGRQHEDHYHQMAAYAFLLWEKAGRPVSYVINVSIVYLEDLSIHPYTFGPAALLAWDREVSAQVLGARYVVGRKCAVCPLHASCPAYAEWGREASALFNDDTTVPQKSWEQMTPQQRGQLIDRMYAVEKAIDRAKLGLRNLVKQKGRVDIGDGKEMVLIDDSTTFLDTRKALPIVTKRIGQQAIVSLARLPLDSVLTAYANKAAKGQKVRARQELMAELEAAGAVVRATSTKMFRRPSGEKILEGK